MNQERVILFLVGVCLSIAQFVMIRDFVTILYGEEVVIVLVTAAFFAGLSLGYQFSLRFSRLVFERLFLVCALLHLTIPFSYRYVIAWFAAMEVGGWTYCVLLFLWALVFSSPFACFLPRLVHSPESGGSGLERLRILYSCELFGFAAGFGVVALSWNLPLVYLLPVYWIFLAVVLHLALEKTQWTLAFICLAVLSGAGLNGLDRDSTARLYEHKHGKDGARVLMSVNSAYQKVEVIDDEDGERYLYLDGLQNLNASDLEALNFFIAEVPARLVKPSRSMIIGNGTLSSVGRVAPHSGFVDSVELDAGVLLAGRRFFTSPESLESLDRWRLTVDDGKHFLKVHEDRYDLIIMDIPSPLTIQETTLHTVEFYRLARRRLGGRGVIAVQLSGSLQSNNRTPARVVAALFRVFKQVMVVDSSRADRSFAYAADELSFTPDDVLRASRDFDSSVRIIQPERIPGYIKHAVPLSLDDMDLVLRRGWERFLDRYFDED